MAQQYGIQPPSTHVNDDHRPAARYLVVIDSGGVSTAKLFLEDRSLVADFGAGSEEVALMTRGLVAQATAGEAAWDEALQGHKPAERAAAQVYLLDV
jgi:hypothetical protein